MSLCVYRVSLAERKLSRGEAFSYLLSLLILSNEVFCMYSTPNKRSFVNKSVFFRGKMLVYRHSASGLPSNL